MAALVTPPNGTSTLTTSATYDSATVSPGSTLAIQGPGTVVTVAGPTLQQGQYIKVGSGSNLRLLGSYTATYQGAPYNLGATIYLADSATVEIAAGSPLIEELPLNYGVSTTSNNAGIVVDGSQTAVSILGFFTSDYVQFGSPATSVTYTPVTNIAQGVYAVGTLRVTEQDGTTTLITLDAAETAYGGIFRASYQQANFGIRNGVVYYQSIPVTTPPLIAGTAGGQRTREGTNVLPFGRVSITDTNAGATDEAVVQLAAASGSITDPNAATDGSTITQANGATTFSVTAAPTALTALVNALVFTPATYTVGSGSFTTSITLGVISSAGSSASDATTSVVTYPPIIPANFAANGMSSLLIQYTGGQAVVTTDNGLSVTAGTSIGTLPGSWHLVAAADFNGDGSPDTLYQNDNGALVDFAMSGTAIAAGYSLGNPGPSWHVRGTGDFNSDGRADILVQNDNGSLVVLETNGAGIVGSAVIGAPLPSGWAVEAVADFSGDGRPDLLVQGPDGTLVEFTLAGTAIASSAVVGNPGPGYSVAGAADYNADGRADILLHNDDGVDVVWTMNGGALTGSVFVTNAGAGLSTTIAGLDLDGDGHADLVVQDTASSTLTGYLLDGAAHITASAVLGTPGVGWNAIGSNPITFLDGTSPTSLAGTPGPDQFVLTMAQDGLHTITTFNPAQDTLALSAGTFPTYAALQAHEVAYQGGTFIGLSNTAAIVIQGVAPTALSAANFVLR